MVIVFNATFNNISVISWPSVLLVEEAEDPNVIFSSLHSTIGVTMLFHVGPLWS
jgi:hypothetical protein